MSRKTSYEEARQSSLESLLEQLVAGFHFPDWTDLPVFGGKEPEDTAGVWSWDSENLLVGTCIGDLEIVSRSWYAEELPCQQ